MFYQEVQRFKASPNKLEHAKSMKNVFFNVDSPLQLNLDDAGRREVMAKIDKGDVNENLFHQVEKDAQHFLLFGVFKEWLGESKDGLIPTPSSPRTISSETKELAHERLSTERHSTEFSLQLEERS